MTDVELDVGLIEAEFEVGSPQVTIEVSPANVDLSISPPSLIELDVSAPPPVEVTITSGDIALNVVPPPIVNFSVGGDGTGSGGVCHVPPGGAANQVLTKRTNADFALMWAGGGNHTYHTPEDTLPPDDLLVPGDLWIDGDDANATYRWDGTEWIDVHNLNIDHAYSGIEQNADQINLINEAVRELQVHVEDTEKTSNTNDGRVTMSDYVPAPEDVNFAVISTDPETGDNVVTYIPRIEGSLWFQRTRPRRNLISNPSFEKNAVGWQATNALIARVDPPSDVPVIAGDYCLEVTSQVTGDALIETTYTFAVSESKWYAGSMHMMLITGSGVGCFATFAFYDASNNMLVSVMGEIEDLVQAPPDAEHWNRINVVAQAPATATTVRFQLHNPNPSDRWYAGGAIVENLDELGKYFDGDSYDGFWEGGTGDPINNPGDNPGDGEQGWQESTSRLYGNKIIGVWELHAEVWVRKFFTEDTLDQIDSSKITNLEHLAEALPPNAITTDKISVGLVISTEALAKGDIVNVYPGPAGFSVRRASAALNFEASGFVLDEVPSFTPVRVYSDGLNTLQTGLSPGPQWLSDVSGRVTNTPPSTVGMLVQQVGFAADQFMLSFHPLLPIKLV